MRLASPESVRAPQIKTGPYLSHCSIKSLFFFNSGKKHALAQLRINPEQSAIIWGLNEATQTVWYSAVSRSVGDQLVLCDSLSVTQFLSGRLPEEPAINLHIL